MKNSESIDSCKFSHLHLHFLHQFFPSSSKLNLKSKSKLNSQKVKDIFHKFSWKFPNNLILISRIQRLNSFSQIFSSSFLHWNFLICKFAFTLLIFICWLLHVFIHFSRKQCIFWNVLQKLLFPQLSVLFLQYHNKITKNFWVFNGHYYLKLFYISPNINV